MPYTKDNPPDQISGLPSGAKSIWISAFNNAAKDNDEESAHKIAWSAVRNKYKKDGDTWVKKESWWKRAVDKAEFNEMWGVNESASVGDYVRATPEIMAWFDQVVSPYELGQIIEYNEAKDIYRVRFDGGHVIPLRNVDFTLANGDKEDPLEDLWKTSWWKRAEFQEGDLAVDNYGNEGRILELPGPGFDMCTFEVTRVNRDRNNGMGTPRGLQEGTRLRTSINRLMPTGGEVIDIEDWRGVSRPRPKISWWKRAVDPVGSGEGPIDEGFVDHQSTLDTNKGLNLQGLPGAVNVPNTGRLQFNSHGEIQNIARNYNQQYGIESEHPTDYQKVQPEISSQIAQEYDQMPHNPQDPAVQESYDALKRETLEQYKAAVDAGYTFEFYPEGSDPYPNSPREAVLDLHNNKHMYVYPTDEGFGSGDEEYPDHPLTEDTGIRWDGKPVLYNDLFRAIHDFYGHAKEGLGFRADGEDNAYRQHAAMFSPAARKAMTSETRGQNSWVNYGEFGEHNQTAGQADTVFAPQKAGIMPDWVEDPNIHAQGQGQQQIAKKSWWKSGRGGLPVAQDAQRILQGFTSGTLQYEEAREQLMGLLQYAPDTDYGEVAEIIRRLDEEASQPSQPSLLVASWWKGAIDMALPEGVDPIEPEVDPFERSVNKEKGALPFDESTWKNVKSKDPLKPVADDTVGDVSVTMDYLQRNGLDIPTMVDNILEVLSYASPQDLVEGKEWYERIGSKCEELSKQLPYTKEQLCAVFAVCSPQTNWEENEIVAEKIIWGHYNGEMTSEQDVLKMQSDTYVNGLPKQLQGYPRDRQKAWRILEYNDLSGVDGGEALPTELGEGQKVHNFFQNFMGNTDLVTADVWATRIAIGQPNTNPQPAGAAYDVIEEAYTTAATEANMTPRDLQAAIWVYYRRVGGTLPSEDAGEQLSLIASWWRQKLSWWTLNARTA